MKLFIHWKIISDRFKTLKQIFVVLNDFHTSILFEKEQIKVTN